MGVVQDRARKSKNNSRTLVGNKLYEWETTCIVEIVRLRKQTATGENLGEKTIYTDVP